MVDEAPNTIRPHAWRTRPCGVPTEHTEAVGPVCVERVFRDHGPRVYSVALRLLGSFDRAMLLLDGQESLDLAAGDEIEVGLTRATVRIFQNPARPFGRSLQAKLGWQGSERRSL